MKQGLFNREPEPRGSEERGWISNTARMCIDCPVEKVKPYLQLIYLQCFDGFLNLTNHCRGKASSAIKSSLIKGIASLS